MKTAFQLAYQHAQTAGSANKRRYDAKVNTVSIVKGDHVLVRKLSERGGTGKLRSWWEQKIYVVVDVHDLVPVFTVRPIDGRKTKTVHRNMIMRVNDLPLHTFGQVPVQSPPVAATRRRVPRKKLGNQILSGHTTTRVCSSDSSDAMLVWKQRPVIPQPAMPVISDGDSSDSEVLVDQGVMAFDATEFSTDDEHPLPLRGSEPSSSVDSEVNAMGSASDDNVPPLESSEEEIGVSDVGVDRESDVVSVPSLSSSDEGVVEPVPVLVSDVDVSSDEPAVNGFAEEPQLFGSSASSLEETFHGFSEVSDDEADKTLAPDGAVAADVTGPGVDVSGLETDRADDSLSNEEVPDGDSQTSEYGTPEESPPPVRPSFSKGESGPTSSRYRSDVRRSTRRKKSKHYLTYDSDFRQTTTRRYDLLNIHKHTEV